MRQDKQSAAVLWCPPRLLYFNLTKTNVWNEEKERIDFDFFIYRIISGQVSSFQFRSKHNAVLLLIEMAVFNVTSFISCFKCLWYFNFSIRIWVRSQHKRRFSGGSLVDMQGYRINKLSTQCLFVKLYRTGRKPGASYNK